MDLAICRPIKTSRCHCPLNHRILYASACYFAPVRDLHERLISRSGGNIPRSAYYCSKKFRRDNCRFVLKGRQLLELLEFLVVLLFQEFRLSIARTLRNYGSHKDPLCCRGGISCRKSGSCRQWARYHTADGLLVVLGTCPATNILTLPRGQLELLRLRGLRNATPPNRQANCRLWPQRPGLPLCHPGRLLERRAEAQPEQYAHCEHD